MSSSNSLPFTPRFSAIFGSEPLLRVIQSTLLGSLVKRKTRLILIIAWMELSVLNASGIFWSVKLYLDLQQDLTHFQQENQRQGLPPNTKYY